MYEYITVVVWQVALAFVIPALVGSLAKDVLDTYIHTYTYIDPDICDV